MEGGTSPKGTQSLAGLDGVPFNMADNKVLTEVGNVRIELLGGGKPCCHSFYQAFVSVFPLLPISCSHLVSMSTIVIKVKPSLGR
jgi:hypothetical protein